MQTYAHSDDEFDEDNKLYVIKTLAHCSNNANKWMRRFEAWMERSNKKAGWIAQQRMRKLPKVPQPSRFNAPPVQLPIDFYNHWWYNGLTAVQKEKFVKHDQVALLPDASESFIPSPNTHPDEKISGIKFNKKYYDRLTKPYQINTPGKEVDEDEGGPKARGDTGNHDEEMDDSIDLEGSSEGSDEEDKAANSLFFEDGDFGELYDMDEEDEDWGKSENDNSGSDNSSSVNEEDTNMHAGDDSDPEEEL